MSDPAKEETTDDYYEPDIEAFARWILVDKAAPPALLLAAWRCIHLDDSAALKAMVDDAKEAPGG